jgi:uncharacterized protein
MISFHRAFAFSGCFAARALVAACLAGSAALCGAAEGTASGPRSPLLTLLLPLDAPEFAAAAAAVAEGCRASLDIAGNPLSLQLARTDATGPTIVNAYNSAIERGAAVVVGPMTRDGVTAIIRNVRASAPTLTLNMPEGETIMPSGFYVFGLSADQEARLIARKAFASGRRSPGVAYPRTALGRRMAQAFTNEWISLGGALPESQDFGQDATLRSLRQRLARVDVLFLAGEASDARMAAPYLPRNVITYAASVVHTGRPNALTDVDLDGIRIFEMPWLVQADHPAVMVYPRPEAITGDLQRFYALGIDACRIAPLLARHQERIEIDGVTGYIHMGPGGLLEREPVSAVFRGGAPVVEP